MDIVGVHSDLLKVAAKILDKRFMDNAQLKEKIHIDTLLQAVSDQLRLFTTELSSDVV